jgi:hypothetical protein
VRPLDLDLVGVTLVVVGDDAAHKGTIVVESGKVRRAAQQERLLDTALHMAVPALDGTVLVRDAAVIAGRHHAVMCRQRGEPAGEVLRVIGTQVAERSRQAVGAMLVRRASQNGQRPRQPRRQRGVAFPAQHDLGVLEARIHQREMVEPVNKRDA